MTLHINILVIEVVKLEQMLQLQKEYTAKVILKKYGKNMSELTNQEKNDFMKDLVLHIVDECFEFLRELDWKMHKRRKEPIDRYAAVEELIDVSKFLMNFLVIMEVDYEEFKRVWLRKHQVVEDRWVKENSQG